MSHTPGEWWFKSETHEVLAPVVDGDEKGKRDLEVGYDGYLVAESVERCNGHLIAAAPELLAACEALIRALDGVWTNTDALRALVMARKAVMKSRGGR